MNQREPAPADADDFRWQALFQRSTDPVFVLSRRRRVLFVNRAWEALTGVPLAQARGLHCRHLRPTVPGNSSEAVLAHALCPPPEALRGTTATARRVLPASAVTGGVPRWWDIEFVPLREGDAVCGVLGRVTPLPPAAVPDAAALPEQVVALRRRAAGRYGMEWLASEVPAMRRLAEQVRLAAAVPTPALLVGEAGSGKETVARLIHNLSDRRERAFVALDCGRLPTAAVAELLLAPQTEAHRRAMGTVYFREPQRLPAELQRDLLTLFAADGAPRLLAGVRNPSREKSQRLLPELWCALSVLVLRVPPLRERRADLAQLVERFLPRAAPAEGAAIDLTPAAWESLRAYPWPGNLSELYVALASARAAAGAGPIDAGHLPGALRLTQRLADEPARELDRPLPLDRLLEEAERRLIQLALQRAKGKKRRAAELLGVPRPRLWRRMIALGLAEPGAEPLAELELEEDE
jgi:transcriptional regulator with PAS, ATPase and Fis domain